MALKRGSIIKGILFLPEQAHGNCQGGRQSGVFVKPALEGFEVEQKQGPKTFAGAE